MIAQVLRNGVVVNAIGLADGATIASDGLSWTETGGATHAAPDGCVLMSQPGAGVGWSLSGGVLVAPAPPAVGVPQLRAYANAKMDRMRAAVRPYTLTGGLSVMADATQGTGVDLQALLNWGTANNSANTNWVDNNGGVVTLTGAQCVALAQAVLAYGQDLFAVLATAMNGVANQTITTTAAIDALAWPA